MRWKVVPITAQVVPVATWVIRVRGTIVHDLCRDLLADADSGEAGEGIKRQLLRAPASEAYPTSTTSSNSTGMSIGKTLTPTAALAGSPCSPKMSLNRSVAPFATFGCS